MINKQSYQIQGMRQDNLVGSGFSNKFAHEIMNMRLNTIGDYTTGVWTTEKGTLALNNIEDEGTYIDLTGFKPLGQAIINDVWVLFGKDSENDDCIVRFQYNTNDELTKSLLYKGNLHFDFNYPIETLTFFENEDIQKVYWTDGLNQPRVINIAPKIREKYQTTTNPLDANDIETRFDFIPEVSLNETVDITKDSNGTGLFPPGTVKYCITYYHLYGQESNIVYESPLYYPTLGTRACSPDELSGDSFTIKVSNIDQEHGFDYIRLYSIVRTSDNATPIVRIVEDRPIEGINEVTFLDTNTKGEIVDPNILNYLGGREITAETFNQKDNTLFLGNIELKKDSLKSVLTLTSDDEVTFEKNNKEVPIRAYFSGGDIERTTSKYSYLSQLNTFNYTKNNTIKKHYGNSYEVKVFKYNEWYRFGIQAQDNKGNWSDIVHISDAKNIVLPELDGDFINPSNSYTVGNAVFTLDADKSRTLKGKDYKKVRLVCCYPTNADRSRIAQGILSKTVYNTKERKDHSPDVMSSWWFRPLQNETYNVYKYEFPSWRLETSNKILPTDEIQSQGLIEDDDYPCYEIENNVWTLNSPDIELDESIRTLDSRAFNLNTIGAVNIDFTYNSLYVDALPAYSPNKSKGKGLSQKTNIDTSELHFVFGKWNDWDVYYPYYTGNPAVAYKIYPFQRNILNNYIKNTEWYNTALNGDDIDWIPVTIEQTAKINSKVTANLLYSNNTNFKEVNTNITNVKSVSFFDSSEVTPIIFENGNIYYGNVNTIVPLATDDKFISQKGVRLTHDGAKKDASFTGNYYIENVPNFSRDENEYRGLHISPNGHVDVPVNTSDCFVTADPISIAYKSTPHIVCQANISTNIDGIDVTNKTLLLADIIRNVSNEQRFGGTHNENNIYVPCGPAVDIDQNGTTIYGYEGDHYLMRYDCLKTYPYTTEDVNQIVEIASYYTETRINLDGRYDRNRGLVDNTTVLPTNFNLINKSYTQSNNFFSYTEIDDLSANLDKFINQFTWTKEKVSGEKVDAWTNITLASTADADGTLGSITKISNLNNNLLLFQDHGLAQIGYNENTAISTENGVPLELAKTGKYTGLNYISREIGCQNKWSISQSKNGIFWIDDSRQEMLRYSDGIQSLSSSLGFDAFMIKELPSPFKTWNPDTFDNFVTYYDKLSNDVYYINSHYCLAWNELSQTFTSFYNYELTPYMVNIGQHSLLWNDGLYAAREADTYSTFFGSNKNYWMTIVCDGQTDKGSAFSADKVFNNIEFRADVFNMDGMFNNFEHAGPYNAPVFNIKHVWNGYQDSHEVALDGERKFNTWRVQLPRHYQTRDRIRNPFCYIKLKQDQSVNTQTDRMILHDLAVYFDMR